MSLQEVSGPFKVKLFSHTIASGLEKDINDWLEKRGVIVADIIYQHSMTTEDEVYSCLVIYGLPVGTTPL